MDRALLILDLDETLIHACRDPARVGRPPDFRTRNYAVYRRPHLDKFLEFAFENFDVAVWTSSSRIYAERVTDAVFESRKADLHFLWSNERCTMRYDLERFVYYPTKNLRKVKRRGYALERTIAVDDTPQKYEQSYGNLVRIEPFEGDASDFELLLLESYLATLIDAPNIREVEKRGWRNRYAQPLAASEPSPASEGLGGTGVLRRPSR